ncbi:Ubiquitin carboxyl-terminal hydrolase family protein [Striga hermonthica]|uniref:Ubiquitin carboxyl-terminal hydrolase family protein n=1 Tax=Striga hermonthica TaxID=68872 RepID=A0A9N7MPY2_STRHE|nr:Ubiquitin carboxyl-terminal hydrolase family protein [Striga hermonthica]
MEPKFLISPYKAPPSVCALPFFLSFNSSLFQKPKSCSDIRVSVSSNNPKKTAFLGQNLVFRKNYELPTNLSTRFPVTRAGPVKRRKELPFDNVIERDKKLKVALKIRKILMSQPDRVMALRELGRFRKALGLHKRRRFIALLKKFPAVFEVVEEGAYSLKFKLTPEAERLYLEELKIRNEMEDLLVIKLRKLLMMSIDKRILLEKIAHLKADFGLPTEFRNTICHRYPQYFRVVPTGRGQALELTHWDPDLAVSAAELAEEENRQRELDEKDLIIDRTPKFIRVKLPKGLNLSRGEMRRIEQFRDMPYISPYSDFSGLRAGTREKEKHACGVVHEILSLTAEKRTLVDHLTHFREEFRFSQQLRGMLVRHPDMFYVSLKGDRDSVFLREAYRDSQLIEKDKMLLVKEKFRALVNVPRVGRQQRSEDEQEGESDMDEWSDIDDLESDEYDDDGDNDDENGDEWSDDDDGDDDVPPDFNDEEYDSLQVGKMGKNVNGSSKNQDKKVLLPVFPDGRPRERW